MTRLTKEDIKYAKNKIAISASENWLVATEKYTLSVTQRWND